MDSLLSDLWHPERRYRKEASETPVSVKQSEEGSGRDRQGAKERSRAAKVQADETQNESGLKKLQNLRDHLRDGIENIQYVPRFPDRYISGQAGLEIHVRVGTYGSDRNSKYFVARSRRVSGEGIVEIRSPINSVGNKFAIPKLNGAFLAERSRLRCNVHHVDAPVFIGVIESAEPAQSLNGMNTPTRSRDRAEIERLELFELLGVSNEHVFPIDVRLIPYGLIEANRKLNLFNGLSVGRFDAIETPQRQLPSKMVEGTPQVMGGISHDQTPVVADIYDSFDAPNYSPIFWLELLPQRDEFRVRGPLSINLGPKRIDVYFRTFELRPGATKF
jgi:hypothetical protein